MAVKCPQCGADYDVTLFTFGRRIRCDCGAWVDLAVVVVHVTEDDHRIVVPLHRLGQRLPRHRRGGRHPSLSPDIRS